MWRFPSRVQEVSPLVSGEWSDWKLSSMYRTLVYLSSWLRWEMIECWVVDIASSVVFGTISELVRLQWFREAGCDVWFDKPFKTLHHSWCLCDVLVVIQTGYNRFLFCQRYNDRCFQAYGDDGLAEGDVENIGQDICQLEARSLSMHPGMLSGPASFRLSATLMASAGPTSIGEGPPLPLVVKDNASKRAKKLLSLSGREALLSALTCNPSTLGQYPPYVSWFAKVTLNSSRIGIFHGLDPFVLRRQGWSESSLVPCPEGCISGCQQRGHPCNHPWFMVATCSEGLQCNDILCAWS